MFNVPSSATFLDWWLILGAIGYAIVDILIIANMIREGRRQRAQQAADDPPAPPKTRHRPSLGVEPWL